MKLNQAGLELIKQFEGLSLKPYQDVAGIWSVGFGHCGGVTEHTPPITREQAEEWLMRDVAEAEAVVNAHVKVPLNENQFSACVSFVFNIGPGRHGYKDGFVWLRNGHHSTLLTLLNGGQHQRAAQEFCKWHFAAGKSCVGLLKRRVAERDLFLRPVEPQRKEA